MKAAKFALLALLVVGSAGAAGTSGSPGFKASKEFDTSAKGTNSSDQRCSNSAGLAGCLNRMMSLWMALITKLSE